MFCPNCGTQNFDNATFCKSCGTSLVAINGSSHISDLTAPLLHKEESATLQQYTLDQPVIENQKKQKKKRVAKKENHLKKEKLSLQFFFALLLS